MRRKAGEWRPTGKGSWQENCPARRGAVVGVDPLGSGIHSPGRDEDVGWAGGSCLGPGRASDASRLGWPSVAAWLPAAS